MSEQHCENYDVKRETVHCYPRNVADCVFVVLKHSLEILNWMDKGKTLPMLAKVFRADLSLHFEEKNSISSIVCSPCGTILGALKTNLATEMSQILRNNTQITAEIMQTCDILNLPQHDLKRL